MKVIYIFDEDDRYGAAKAGCELILEMKKNGISPVVLTSLANGINKFCNEEGIENYVTHHRKFTYAKTTSKMNNLIKWLPRYIRYIIGNMRALKIIKNSINMSQIDLIHTNNSGIYLGILLQKKYRIPHIIHLREFGVGEKNFNVHTYIKNYIKIFNTNTNKFISISDAVKRFWIDKGLNKEKIVRIYDGVRFEDVETKKEYISDDKLKIIMLGSISYGKGQIDLIEAINTLDEAIKKNIVVDIIGDGYPEEEDVLKTNIEKYNLKNIVNIKKYDSNIRKKICNYDLGVVCSKAEGFGRVTIEYLAAGICVIASNKGANEEIIKNGLNGYIYNGERINNLKKVIADLYNNRYKIKKVAENANKDLNKYSIEKNVDEIIKLYKELKK